MFRCFFKIFAKILDSIFHKTKFFFQKVVQQRSIRYRTKKKLQQKRLWRFSIFSRHSSILRPGCKISKDGRCTGWISTRRSATTTFSNASCSTAKKRRCYIASILRETRTRKVIESLDEFSFFYRRVEKYLLLNSFCTHNTGQRVSKDQFRNSDNIVECRKALCLASFVGYLYFTSTFYV